MGPNHIGTQTIETERLLLRQFEITDLDDVFTLWLSDPEVQHNYGEPTYDTLTSAQQLLDKWIQSYEDQEFYRWGIALKETNVCIGQIDFYKIDNKNSRAEVEYCISKAYRGKGFAPEALQAVIDYAFHQIELNRIQAFHRSMNPASGMVLRKAGMLNEGILKQYILHQNEFDDCVIYAITRNEWLNKESKDVWGYGN